MVPNLLEKYVESPFHQPGREMIQYEDRTMS